MTRRTLLVMSTHGDSTAQTAVAEGRWPRKDFLELARALDADVLDLAALDASPAARAARRVAGPAVAQALLAFARRGRYDRIFTDGEHIGLPLAALLARCRRRPRHVTIGHLLSTRSKRLFARALRPAGGLDLVLLHATSQVAPAHALGLRAGQTRLIPYGVDTRFWAPRPAPQPQSLICSAGLEYRDYGTLMAAVDGLPLRAVLAAGSRWSRHSLAAGTTVPANVEITRLDYTELRALYAAARFVVVPLHDVANQAGVTTLLEAMAMGKAVIVTATRGQRDVVRGRLWTAAGPANDVIGDPRAFGVDSAEAPAETGLYVAPGDAGALRAAIRHLLDHPEEAERLGAAGRALVQRSMTLGRYVAQIAAAVAGPLSLPLPPELGARAGIGGPATAGRCTPGFQHT